MPLFDFICHTCGEEFEALVVGNDKPNCPRCQSADLKKQMSTFSMRTGSSGNRGSSGSSGGGPKCSGCAGGSCSTCH